MNEGDDAWPECPGDSATCLCDHHVMVRHEAALAKLSGKERKAARGKLLGSDFAVTQSHCTECGEPMLSSGNCSSVLRGSVASSEVTQ